jgi:RNA polymerase sigma-70 factor (ECF subfamily)
VTDNLLPFRRATEAQRSDGDLVLACAAGDRSALEELFRRHGERVRRIVVRLRYVHRGDLDDVLQTTFLEVYRSAKRYSGRAAVGTWIIGITMNVVRHYVRGESRRKSALSELSILAQAPVGVRPPTPDEEIAHKQLLAQLEAGFESLSENLRIVFTLCDLEEMRGVDVARALEIPEGTVWRRLHNARRHLRRALEADTTR